ncbi:DNA polymerase Y family protein [Nitratireductor basaltis]|uniref:DNA-directed DNA polymerase n=1 Tax=Nitratireductor basaltis TaxID=472175 RepID=A0A084U6E4_9HYPH|nr:DNA polymerase Y family protein [Nitratireductor basaltis]KFB08530.1 hypothetical protein EL18_02782 [Nitratireductor basaltis]
MNAVPAEALPLVISERQNNAQRILALDEKAQAAGLSRGMGIADARAMHPSLEVIEADRPADQRLLEGLADWCDRYTPLVALGDEGDGLFLDISGCAHLFGGESRMLEEIVERLLQQGFDIRTGLASTPGAAWAAARFSPPPGEIADGCEAEALDPLPLAALRLDEKTVAGLESVGLGNIAALLDAPRAPLVRRFGRHLATRIDQALGNIEEAISPRLPVSPLSVERHLSDPIGTLEEIESLLRMLATTLKEDLEQRDQGARQLQLALFRVDGAVSRISIGTSRPLRDPVAITRLFHEKLARLEESLDPGYGFDLVRLAVPASAPFDARQGDLAGQQEDEGEGLALLADRISARLGSSAILIPQKQMSHQPERAVALTRFAQAKPDQRFSQEPSPIRPIRLLTRPEPVEAAAEIPEGPPFSFRWRRALFRVARAEGPERIAGEWWRTSAPPARDYFRVEDTEGRRYWLYREGFYGEGENHPRWFMHGFFP